jgi:hypothetical protein
MRDALGDQNAIMVYVILLVKFWVYQHAMTLPHSNDFFRLRAGIAVCLLQVPDALARTHSSCE